ncbi:uncharacterized protein BDV17DRAFT_289180 [Aspergillus undulatus]|uniref:uncharacterized protein n=1 Tax=Aspergillus undulatus TaxID=1810928 RepID=UPI003CCE17D5
MSQSAATEQMVHKKQISKQEYSLREEWAPETVKAYQVSPVEPVQRQHQHQTQGQNQTQAQHHAQALPQVNPHSQARIPNKRSQPRSSSLFEEWKAKALRSPTKEKTEPGEPGVLSTAESKANRNKDKLEESITSGDVRVLLGEHSEKTVSIRGKPKKPGVGVSPAPAAASKARNNVNEGGATSVDATGSLPEHSARTVNAQMETKEPGVTSPAVSNDNSSKHSGSITTGHSTGPSSKDNSKNEGTSTVSGGSRRSRTKSLGKASVRAKSREPGTASAAAPKKGNDDKGSTAAVVARQMLGECSDQAANVGPKTKPAGNDHSQQPEASRASNVKEESYACAPPSDNVAPPAVNLETNTTSEPPRRGRTSQPQRCEWERQYSRGRQRSLERDNHFRAQSLERTPYMAPSGILLGVDDLRKLALGTMFKGKDKVYFIPSFIEDPWKGLKPVPSIRPPDLMDRF